MGGIIQGFLGGASQGMADAGRMLLADKLSKERKEADFLRESEFSKGERIGREEFTTETAETKAGTDADAATKKAERAAAESKLDRESREAIAKKKAGALVTAAEVKSGSGAPTSQMKNINDLVNNKGHSLESAIQLVYPNATIKHTDAEGNQIVVVKGDDGKFHEVGKIMINDAGNQVWVDVGKKLKKTKPTKKDRKAKAKELNKASGAGEDYIPFNELSPKSQEVRDAAQADLDASNSRGIVGSQSGGETKQVGNQQMTKADFIAAMVKKHGRDKMAEIEETWNSIK